MKHRLIACLALAALASCGSEKKKGEQMSAEEVAQEMSALKIEPGQWQATNEIISASAPGLPVDALKQMVGQKSTVSNCVTPEEAAKPSANFLTAQKNMDCTYQDFSMDDGKMTGTMSCTGGQMPGRMVMKMAGDYSPRAYDMNMDMEAGGLPGGMKMTIKARTIGRRVGDCA